MPAKVAIRFQREFIGHECDSLAAPSTAPKDRSGNVGCVTDATLRELREAVVREHMESENRHEFDVTMSTFGHPRYEIVPTGDVYDGEEEVARYFAESRAAFPDQRNELVKMHHADDAVIVEFDLLGTHLGELRGMPPTGRSFTCRTLAIFEFEGEGIVCERVYFDAATIMRQLMDG